MPHMILICLEWGGIYVSLGKVCSAGWSINCCNKLLLELDIFRSRPTVARWLASLRRIRSIALVFVMRMLGISPDILQKKYLTVSLLVAFPSIGAHQISA